MIVKDPGHWYTLDTVDGTQVADLVFVKREGSGYPGNTGHYPGVLVQEVLRACIDRLQYLEGQIPYWGNRLCIMLLRHCIKVLEDRTRLRRGHYMVFASYEGYEYPIEREPTCKKCGHIRCLEHAR